MSSDTVMTKIVGLSWRRLADAADDKLNKVENCSFTRKLSRRLSRTTHRPLREGCVDESDVMDVDKENRGSQPPAADAAGDKVGTLLLKRAQSVKDAFGSIRQKLRVSTRRKKRLVNQASPFCTPRMLATPASARRSSRLAEGSTTKMYSPFTIDTPTRTPRQIRMGTHTPRRFNFSSPGRYKTDVKSVEAGIRALSKVGNDLERVIKSQSTAASRERNIPQRVLAHQQYAARLAEEELLRRQPIFV